MSQNFKRQKLEDRQFEKMEKLELARNFGPFFWKTINAIPFKLGKYGNLKKFRPT